MLVRLYKKPDRELSMTYHLAGQECIGLPCRLHILLEVISIPYIQCRHTTVNCICLLIWDLNAELLNQSSTTAILAKSRMYVPTSSIAITTSTVSKLSSPRSFAKCELGDSYQRQFLRTKHYHAS
jgi:hypothetical protein